MKPLDSPDHSQEHLSENLLFQLKSKTGSILDNVSAFLKSGALKDEADRKFIVSVAAFIEKPTENLQDIMDHTIKIAEVLGGYDMQGMDIPTEIDAMHAYLQALICINRMNFVETELEKGTATDSSDIQDAMAIAFDKALTLSKKVYKDNTFLKAVNELKGRIYPS